MGVQWGIEDKLKNAQTNQRICSIGNNRVITVIPYIVCLMYELVLTLVRAILVIINSALSSDFVNPKPAKNVVTLW